MEKLIIITIVTLSFIHVLKTIFKKHTYCKNCNKSCKKNDIITKVEKKR